MRWPMKLDLLEVIHQNFCGHANDCFNGFIKYAREISCTL